MIIISQVASIVFRAEYERDELINMLVEAGDDADVIRSLPDAELGERAVTLANEYRSVLESNVYSALTDDAGDYDPDSLDTEDWTFVVRPATT